MTKLLVADEATSSNIRCIYKLKNQSKNGALCCNNRRLLIYKLSDIVSSTFSHHNSPLTIDYRRVYCERDMISTLTIGEVYYSVTACFYKLITGA